MKYQWVSLLYYVKSILHMAEIVSFVQKSIKMWQNGDFGDVSFLSWLKNHAAQKGSIS